VVIFSAFGRAALVAATLSFVSPESVNASPFEDARVLRSQHDYAAANDILRELLRADPNNIAVREELGYVLLLDGQMAAAQHQFTLLNERVTDPHQRALYRAVLRRIVAERPVGVSLIFGFTPSSNINQGTDNRLVEGGALGSGTIAPESRRISGWHSRIGLRGYVRGNVSAQGQIIFDWRAERRIYSELFEPESQIELGVTYSRRSEKINWGVRTFGLFHRGDSTEYDHKGIAVFGSVPVADRFRLDGRLQVSELDYQDSSVRDAQQVFLEAGVQYALRAATVFRFAGQITLSDSERTSLSYTSVGLSAQANHAFRNGFELTAQILAGQRHYDEALDFARRDEFADISITVYNSRYSFRGVVPKLTCNVGKTHSNVAVYDTTRRACGINLSRKF
jgi:hypothetical protein